MTDPRRRGQNIWIDTDSGFIGAAWYWPLQVPAASTVVVIVPGIVHEERTMNGGLVALAESLADAGLPALLMDLHGCSQSAGRLEDADIGACWSAGIKAAVHHARCSGAARVIVVGVRLGVPLAVEALVDEPLAALIAWAPIVNGRRYVRELKMLQRTTDADAAAAGTIAIGGFSIPASVLDHISHLDLGEVETPATSFVMSRETLEGLNAPWLARLSQRGIIVQEQISTQIHPWLFSATDQPTMPYEDIQALTRWCRVLHDEQAVSGEPVLRRPMPRPVIEFVHQDVLVRETFVEIAPSGLTGVLSEPVNAAGDHPVRLLVSTVGPGRTFADFARDEASRGKTSLRFDFAGFGTSGRGDAAQGGELYTDSGGHDVLAAIEHLRGAGYKQIYSLGFCAGAWSMMQADVVPELRAMVAINVALYRQPDPKTPDSVERKRHLLGQITPALARNRLVRRVAPRLVRLRGKRHEPVDWLVRMCNTNVRMLLAYADLDLGLEYLNRQMDKGVREQLGRPFTLQTYAGLGHLAEGPTARARLFGDITDFFADLDREATSNHAPRAKASLAARSRIAAPPRTKTAGGRSVRS
ncbi:hypothetical protein FPZ24_09130 [Sphingomonas panacisoli]|uniref:Serine aminopeptidase S33 domain-containing protein n=1 Tax=Sphingomonas panacisoli TaxID=1813879 RepID=A0A5B8LJ56_9SPHN|nr:hypothetical protein [Sphingomonas panacisoli]QDZ07632.1 hypothetical protein FPZ24_09130 [Sphingomonas panacisoli]